MLHRLSSERVHYTWNRDLPPILEIESGDTVVFETRDAADGFFSWDSTHADLLRREYRGHPLTGPVAVNGARPGDTLEIEILDLKPGEMGRTSIPPGKGLLPEDFPEPFLKIWDLRNGRSAVLRQGIEIQFEPFHGVMGVALAEPGEHRTSPPSRVGGNLDVKQLTAGSTLWLPIEVEGALFSLGDGHAAQGDGEVCSSAIETSMTTTLRFTLRQDLPLATPQFRTAGPLMPRTNTAGWHATTGIGPDLMEATKQATREMIGHLGRTYDLSPQEAFVLCSVAMDLKISEVVDAPNWVVSAFIPLSIFR